MLTPWGIYETSLGFLEPFKGGGCKIRNEHADKPLILLSALKLHRDGSPVGLRAKKVLSWKQNLAFKWTSRCDYCEFVMWRR